MIDTQSLLTNLEAHDWLGLNIEQILVVGIRKFSINDFLIFANGKIQYYQFIYPLFN